MSTAREPLHGVLQELGIEGKDTLLVLNQIDRLTDRGQLGPVLHRYPNAVPISAKTRAGLDELHDAAVALKKSGIPKPLSFKVSATYFENWLSGEGVDVVNNDNGQDGLATEATFDTAEGKDVMEWLKQMDEEGLLNAFAPTEGSVDHYLALITQQSSMLMETSTASNTIAQAISVRNGAKKAPSESLVNVRGPCGAMAVTVAPGTARPCASTTRPAIDPVVVS